MIMSACQLPGDIREPFTVPTNVLHLRLQRALWRQVVPIDIRSLRRTAESELPVLFRVVFTNSLDMTETIDALEFADKVPFLHVSSIAGPSRLSSEKLSTSSILDFIDSVLQHLSRLPEWQEFVTWTRDSMPLRQRYKGRPLAVPLSLHNVTLPNEIALISFGAKLCAR
jgi:hypothetical protein